MLIWFLECFIDYDRKACKEKNTLAYQALTFVSYKEIEVL